MKTKKPVAPSPQEKFEALTNDRSIREVTKAMTNVREVLNLLNDEDLVLLVSGKVDLGSLISIEVQARGLDTEGIFVGYDKSKLIWEKWRKDHEHK